MDLHRHQEVLSAIRGKTVEIPDFFPILDRWPRKVNPNYSAVIVTADQTIESIFQDLEKVKKLKSADLALFASMFFPNAAIDELKILTLWGIWIFMWDDELDEPNGLHTNNLESGNVYRKQTLKFVEHHLGLGDPIEDPSVETPIIDSFRLIGQHFQKAYSVEQCQLIFDEVKFAMQMSGEEQQVRLSDTIPKVEEYSRIRMGSSGVGPLLAAIDFAYRIRAPRTITSNPRFKNLWNESNIIIWIANDILSMRKEIASEWLINLVSLTFVECGDLQKAVNTAYAALVAAVDRFEAAAEELLSQPKSHTIPEKEAKILVDGLRDAWVGVIYWHFESHRYGLHKVDSRVVDNE